MEGDGPPAPLGNMLTADDERETLEVHKREKGVCFSF